MKSTGKFIAGLTAAYIMISGFAPAQAASRQDDGAKQTAKTVQAVKAAPTGKSQQPELNNMKAWPVRSAETGGTLLFSDSPEIVQEDGILYADTMQGNARILYYHLNGTKENKKIAVVLENLSGEDSIVAVTRGGLGGPSEYYLDVGKSTQTEYFQAPKLRNIHIAGHGRRLLDARMASTVVAPDKLVYGVFDFTTKEPVRVSVVMLPEKEDPLSFVAKAKVLPADSHRLRGTFAGMDRYVTSDKIYDPQKDGTVYFPLADDANDHYRIGIDATDGSIVKNYGNYGVLYSIHIPTRGTGQTRYYLKPCGGVYAGVMTARTGLFGDKDMVMTPNNKTYFGEDAKRTDLADLGTYGNVKPLWLEFSPPGASNLPVEVILQPIK